MESEKVKEVKKALEHCGEKITCQGCPEYNNEPVIDWFKCKKNLLQKALTLINELESENEKLIDKCGEQSVLWRNHFNSIYKTATENYKDRIAELENDFTGYQLASKNRVKRKLKQFAERLKDSGAIKALSEMETMPKLFKNIHNEIVKTIDETLKEFLSKN